MDYSFDERNCYIKISENEPVSTWPEGDSLNLGCEDLVAIITTKEKANCYFVIVIWPTHGGPSMRCSIFYYCKTKTKKWWNANMELGNGQKAPAWCNNWSKFFYKYRMIFPSHFPLVVFQSRAKRIWNPKKGYEKRTKKTIINKSFKRPFYTRRRLTNQAPQLCTIFDGMASLQNSFSLSLSLVSKITT